MKDVPYIYKKAMRPSDFVQMQAYDRQVEFRFDEYAYVLGHARSATYGKGDADRDYNAHPFNHSSVTLTHNGHIRNYNSLDSGVDIQVDSAHVAGLLAKTPVDRAKDALERLEGGFALVWHDARDGSLNFARNDERPLYWCYIEKENTMFWGSELEAIWAILKRNNIKVDGKFRHCTAFKHFKFDIKNLREFATVPFVARQLTRTSTASGSGWKEGTRRLPGPTSALPQGAPSQTGAGTTNGSGDSTKGQVVHMAALHERTESPLIRTITTDLETELASEQLEEVLSPKQRPSRPTSKKKIRKVRQQLGQLGLQLDAVRCFTPLGFREYKNHNPIRGEIYGKDKIRTGLAFACPNVLKALWEATRGKKLYGRISNIATDEAGTKIVILDFAPDMQERFIDRYKSAFEDIEKARKLQEASAAAETGDDLIIEGPMGTRITEEDFKERTKHGCSNCTTELTVADSKNVVWAGPLGQYPICRKCDTEDPKVQEVFANIQGGI
jgi:hypothetical protein